MILMTMSDDKAFHLILILQQVRDIRDNLINSKHRLIRERNPAVDDHDRIFILNRGDIHPDPVQTPQRNNLYRIAPSRELIIRIHIYIGMPDLPGVLGRIFAPAILESILFLNALSRTRSFSGSLSPGRVPAAGIRRLCLLYTSKML